MPYDVMDEPKCIYIHGLFISFQRCMSLIGYELEGRLNECRGWVIASIIIRFDLENPFNDSGLSTVEEHSWHFLRTLKQQSLSNFT